MSFFELGAILDNLPPESALVTAQRGEFTDEQLAEIAKRDPTTHGPWAHVDMLLAAIFDALQLLIHVQIRRAGVQGQQPPAPMRRPGVIDKSAEDMSPQAMAYLNRIRELHAETQAAAAAETREEAS